jgi:hypothetical protein
MNKLEILQKSDTGSRTFIMILDERQIETIANEILQIGETNFNKYVCEITEHGYWLLQEKKRGPIGKMDMKL